MGCRCCTSPPAHVAQTITHKTRLNIENHVGLNIATKETGMCKREFAPVDKSEKQHHVWCGGVCRMHLSFVCVTFGKPCAVRVSSQRRCTATGSQAEYKTVSASRRYTPNQAMTVETHKLEAKFEAEILEILIAFGTHTRRSRSCCFLEKDLG